MSFNNLHVRCCVRLSSQLVKPLFRFCGHGKVHPSITAAGYVLVDVFRDFFLFNFIKIIIFFMFNLSAYC